MDIVGPAKSALPSEIDVLMARIADSAAVTDRAGVSRETVDQLAAAGLLGTALPAQEQRELAERIAMADATTWFCWVQHQTPLRTLAGDAPGVVDAASDALRVKYLPGMRSGELLAAVAFAHVRRPGSPNPVATRVDEGWQFDGTLDWVTSWDIADVVMVMAQGSGEDSETLVCSFLPAGRGPTTAGLTPGEPLDLLAMGGTHTRPLTLDSVVVPDDHVVLVDRAAWLESDARKTSDVNPATFGIARGAIDELDELATQRGDERLRALADTLAHQVRDVRSRAYTAADEDGSVEDRLALRAQALDLCVQAALAVVTARAGAAMQAGRSAERRMREALFLQVQAQTAATRAASLDLILSRFSS